ncbi:insulin-degrading enzyme-like [Haliotis rufescens]|uniref:insulin-degrading enzyme-like n=1 Tax=Haliotis rufescens TaxID=6454 RepID=UPI00201F0787|nr:insulin-degrading enzyme-like [Haliotis rufescens]
MMTGFQELVKKVYRNDDITKSPADDRTYRCLELINGMTVFLVSDPNTDRSAAALDVHIGNMSDPGELPGLAHFCEHMLFLGTEKFPNENEYGKFLNEHGGGSNASTSTEHTTYHFNVGPEHLAGALDRFAQFFLCPLFTESATEREVNAVNSENDKNVKNDARRLYQLGRMLSHPQHPYGRFGTGNKDTLDVIPKQNGTDVRAELLKFHARFYSSNIMQLCVVGQESLDELSEMTVRLFSGVENKNIQIPEWPEHPYQVEQLQRKICVVPVKDVRSLTVTWPIPDVSQYYHSKPASYLSHLLGHEGPGSLLSQLKLEGWSNSLTAGRKSGARGFAFFYVKVDLTEDGLEHTEDIVTLVYQYIHLLQKEGVHQWVHDECKKLKTIKFQFKDKETPNSYATSLARDNHIYKIEEALSGPYLLSEFRPDLILDLLNKLTPQNMSVTVVAKKYKGVTDLSERWYGTQYKVEPYSKTQLKHWDDSGLHDNLHLPDINEFIPENLDLVPREEVTQFPVMIKNDDLTRLWFKQDDKFLLPKSYISLQFYSPSAYTDPGCVCMLSLFVSLMNDALTEYTYSADLAGLSYSFSSSRDGFDISINGYSDKQNILLEKIVEKMTNFTVDPVRFNIKKEKLERSYRNFMADQPSQHATYALSQLMASVFWTKEESLLYLQDVTTGKLEAYIHQLLSRLYIEGLVYGNVTKQGALETVGVVEKLLREKGGTQPLLPSQHVHFREMKLPSESCHLYQMTNSVHKSCCVCVYYQIGMQDTRSNVLLELLKQVIGEPAFDTLRTKEQLGYIVWTRVRRCYGAQGLRLLVQSDKSTPFVDSRIEVFLHAMDTYIQDMSEEDFRNHVTALSSRRLEKPKRMRSQNSDYLSEIEDQVYNFDRDNIEVAHLRTLTKSDLYAFFKEHIAYTAPHRRKVSVHVISTAERDSTDCVHNMEVESSTPDLQPIIVENVSNFKKTLAVYPRFKPALDVTIPTNHNLSITS